MKSPKPRLSVFVALAILILAVITLYVVRKSQQPQPEKPVPSKEHPEETAVVVSPDHVVVLKDGNSVFLYRTNNGKPDGDVVIFGTDQFILRQAEKVARANNTYVLNITPETGFTVPGAQVPIGVYVILAPTKAEQITAQDNAGQKVAKE